MNNTMSLDEKRQAGAEIEITPAMIEAGALALLDYFDDLSLLMACRIAAATAYSVLQGAAVLRPELERCQYRSEAALLRV